MIHRTIDPDLHKSTKHSILHTTNDFTKDTILMSSFGTFTPTDQSDYYKQGKPFTHYLRYRRQI